MSHGNNLPVLKAQSNNILISSSGPGRRFKRVVETIQAQLLSTHDQPSVQALAGKLATFTGLTCFVSFFFLQLTVFSLDEKNGQLSRQSSIPSPRNSQCFENKYEQFEKESVADGKSGSKGTQSNPWKERRESEVERHHGSFFSSFFSLTLPRAQLPHNHLISASHQQSYLKHLHPGWAVAWFGQVFLGGRICCQQQNNVS